MKLQENYPLKRKCEYLNIGIAKNTPIGVLCPKKCPHRNRGYEAVGYEGVYDPEVGMYHCKTKGLVIRVQQPTPPILPVTKGVLLNERG